MSFVPAPIAHIGDQTSPAERLRLAWAATLSALLTQRQMSVKEFKAELATFGCDVTRQAIEQWLVGKTAPRPHHQAAIAKVFRLPAVAIFNVEMTA